MACIKTKIIIAVLCLGFLSACSSSSQTPFAGDNPTLLCMAENPSDSWDDSRNLIHEVVTEVGDENVSVILSNMTSAEWARNLEILQYPACLILDENGNEVYRSYEDFDVEVFVNLIRQLP